MSETKKFDKSLAVTAVRLFKADAVALQKSESAAKEAGDALLAVRKARPEGGFGKWVRENLGRGEAVRQRVYYCLRLAEGKQHASKPDKDVQTIAKGFRKLRAAAKEGDIVAAQKAAERIRTKVDEMLADAKANAKEEKAAAAAA